MTAALLRRLARGVTVLAMVGSVTATAACVQQQSPCSPGPGVGGLAVAVGGRANSPQWAMPVDLKPRIDAVLDATESGKDVGVTLLRVDGDPGIACVLRYDASAQNSNARANARTNVLNAVASQISAVRANSPEANPLKALALAAASAQDGGTVVLLDSGLQTVAPLNFTVEGVLDTDPDDVVEQLARAGQLPNLSGRAVVLIGIGYTAAPQASLDEARRTRLVELWTKLAQRAGASSVVVSDTPNTESAVPGVPEVTPVAVPPVVSVHPGCNTQAIFADSGAVGFVPDSTEFRDPAAARGALTEFGRWLGENPTARSTVVGSVAHYGANTTGGLSLARAHCVRDVLIQTGAQAAQITAVGMGWGPFPTRTGPPGAPHDERNRRVVVELTCA